MFHWKSFENIWSCILYPVEAGETELRNKCVVPFTIAELGQKCLEAASTLKYEPLNSCMTVHSVWIMTIFNVMLLNTCIRNERRKNCEESIWQSQSALVWPLTMPCLIDARISWLVPNHPIQSTFNLIGSSNKHPNIQSHKVTKIHKLTPLTYELFFQNSSKMKAG